MVVYGICQDIKASDEAGAGSELEEMRSKLSSFVRQMNLSELELQTLRKQIVKESRRIQELSKEVLTLKEERDSLAEENKQLNVIKKRVQEMEGKGKLKSEGGDLEEILEECRKELDCEKNQSVDLSLQVQKTRESNAELMVAVKDLEEMLDQKDKKIADICRKLGASDEDTEQRALEAYLLEKKILDLNGELEIYRRDRDELEIQMEQLALDYEILKQKHHEVSYKWEQSRIQEQLKLQYDCCVLEIEQEHMSKIDEMENELQKRLEELTDSSITIGELESKIKRLERELQMRTGELFDSLAAVTLLEHKIKGLEGELKKRHEELSDSLASRSELETQVKFLEEELESRAQEFENDLEVLTCAKIEQEKRAVSAEEALQKLRLKHFDTASRIQEEFKKLSVQMASTLESNERVAIKAVKEADELRKSNEKLQLMKDEYEAKIGGISKEFQELARKLETERTELEISMALLKMELEEKDSKVCEIEHGLETLKVQCDELKYSFHISKEENEKLRRELEDNPGSNFRKNSSSQKAANCSEGCSSKGLQLHETRKTADDRQSDLEDLSTEVFLLKQTNESMMIELKEMQEKYSDLSLRFAEVEGQRQKLMMTVRYPKHARKK
ncbi:hypothetical protein SAY86_027459 [Trapa natans]|uniref:Uncharacterized protein n=1 Tax=Trapa natans TaxID=22666 RepID=A0AAN7QJ61_TRANT|nr:hypothetical protein SAY86_027459 [Trapa natans]